MAQSNVNSDSRFSLRVDWPDILNNGDGEPDEDFGTYDATALEGKLDALAHYTDLDKLTLDESPLIIEVRRVK